MASHSAADLMAGMTGPHLTSLLNRHGPARRVFVESGTFHMKTTRLAMERFREVHTIELHPVWYQEAVDALALQGVHCYHGNSADLIPWLAAKIAEPAFWFLDSHWFNTAPDVAGQDVPLPLWAELEALTARPYPDVICVDDARDFGTDQPTPEWRDVSLERIAGIFPGHREAVVLGDQALIYR